MASNASYPRPSMADCMRLALECDCSVATVKNWYGRRFTRGTSRRLTAAARKLGLWEPAPPPKNGWETGEQSQEAQRRGEGTEGWVPGCGYKSAGSAA